MKTVHFFYFFPKLYIALNCPHKKVRGTNTVELEITKKVQIVAKMLQKYCKNSAKYCKNIALRTCCASVHHSIKDRKKKKNKSLRIFTFLAGDENIYFQHFKIHVPKHYLKQKTTVFLHVQTHVPRIV